MTTRSKANVSATFFETTTPVEICTSRLGTIRESWRRIAMSSSRKWTENRKGEVWSRKAWEVKYYKAFGFAQVKRSSEGSSLSTRGKWHGCHAGASTRTTRADGLVLTPATTIQAVH